MKTSTLICAFCFAIVTALLPTRSLLGKESQHRSEPVSIQPKMGRVLERERLLRLETIARRAESMMELSNVIPTRVWPHAVTDSQGRQGIFICSARPLFEENNPEWVKARRAWVVFGLIAAVKYAEGSELGHIAFTDARGLKAGVRYYYDLDIHPAREIHRDLLSGQLGLDEAYDVIAARWQRVTATHDMRSR